jgi:hypothetical protein
VSDAWDEHFAAAQRDAGGVRRAVAAADVQHFAVGESLLPWRIKRGAVPLGSREAMRRRAATNPTELDQFAR